MNLPVLAICFFLFLILPAAAQEVGIKFDEMKIGTQLVTQSLTGKKLIWTEKYVGKRGDFFVMEQTATYADGTTKNNGTVFYDAKGRRVRSEGKWGFDIHTPFSCFFVVGECTHTYDHPNPLTKKKIKRIKSVSRHRNRLEGNTLIVGAVISDDSVIEFPFELGKYNLRVSSKYNDALGQLRGYKLIEITETKSKALDIEPVKESPDDCKALYEKLKADAPGDISICNIPVKPARYEQCKAPSNYSAERPASHVVIVFDSSGSMAGKIDGKSKMATAKREATRFLSAIEKDVPVGLVVYGHRGDNTDAGKTESCATFEWAHKVGSPRGGVKASIKALAPVGWTPLGGVLDYLKEELSSLPMKVGDKISAPVVYVISDGKETCGGDPVASARALHESGVQAAVNVVGFDVDKETRAQLEAISEAGGGKYFPAKDSKALRKQLDAARAQEAELARYNYCQLLNVGWAEVVHHNANIEMTGCFLHENQRKRFDIITNQIKAFDEPTKTACAADVKQMLYQDHLKEGRWLIKTSKQMLIARKAAGDAARKKSIFFGALPPRN